MRSVVYLSRISVVDDFNGVGVSFDDIRGRSIGVRTRVLKIGCCSIMLALGRHAHVGRGDGSNAKEPRPTLNHSALVQIPVRAISQLKSHGTRGGRSPIECSGLPCVQKIAGCGDLEWVGSRRLLCRDESHERRRKKSE